MSAADSLSGLTKAPTIRRRLICRPCLVEQSETVSKARPAKSRAPKVETVSCRPLVDERRRSSFREARAPKGLEGPVDRRSTAKSLIKLEGEVDRLPSVEPEGRDSRVAKRRDSRPSPSCLRLSRRSKNSSTPTLRVPYLIPYQK